METNKLIGRWLLLGVGLLIIQVLLGGITRLTGSGLSITEWKPLLGALPPMGEGEWLSLFEKYKQIAQFKVLNQDFTLSDFKFIYFWEWLHRNWARFISIVFILPFIYFVWKKMLTRELIPKLLALFFLGLAQGLIGWIMVASGLNDENIYVSHIRLAVHFVSAMVLIAVTFYTALSLLIHSGEQIYHLVQKRFALFLLILITLQLTYGAFLAGLKAGSVAPTWPDINGSMIPGNLWVQNIFHDPIPVHFIHRTLAYLIFLSVLFWYYKTRSFKFSKSFNQFRKIPVMLVFIQLILGIATVLLSVHPIRNGFGAFEYMALLHQLVAMCLAMSFVWILFIFSSNKNS